MRWLVALSIAEAGATLQNRAPYCWMMTVGSAARLRQKYQVAKVRHGWQER